MGQRTRELAVSQEYAFNLDSMAVRVRGRFAVGIPAIAKTIRKVTVGGAAPTGEAQPAAKRAAA